MSELFKKLQTISQAERIKFLDNEINDTIKSLIDQGFSESEIANIEKLAYFDVQNVIPENIMVRQLIELKFCKKVFGV